MDKEKHPYVCPAEFAGSLDNWLRRLVHNPRRILEAYVHKGMTVLDLGCGPGYFTPELADLVGVEGRVIAADLQQGMLDKVIEKLSGTDLEQRVEIHKCQDNLIGIHQKVDFVLAFWMVHEVPSQLQLFEELKSVLKSGGKVMIVEPKIHVTGKAFEKMIDRLKLTGLEIIEWPKVRLSRTVLLSVARLST